MDRMQRLISKAVTRCCSTPCDSTKSSTGDDREHGNAMIEFIGLGLMLMIPTIYFLLSVFSVQSASMAANAASQQAVQMIQAHPIEQVNEASVTAAAHFAAADYSVDSNRVSVSVNCSGNCAAASSIRVDTRVEVALPLIPWVSGASFATVDSSAMVWGGKYR